MKKNQITRKELGGYYCLKTEIDRNCFRENSKI
jgi:hypothetical protein